jgi:copper(I)-binding protein
MTLRHALARYLALPLLLSTGALYADQPKSLKIDKAVARATVGKQANGAAFLQINNQGRDDVLLSVSSPAAARVEIHRMFMEGDVMKMRALPQLALKSGQKLEMKPGNGVHIMLMGLKKPLLAGDKFPLTLKFLKAGKLDITVEVVEMGMPMNKGEGEMHHRHD